MIHSKGLVGGLLIFTLFLGFACQESDEESIVDGKKGKISVDLNLDLEIEITRARVETVNTDSFSVFIIQSTGDTISTFDHAIDVPENINLPVGDYYVIAQSGNLGSAAFDSPYYWGKSDLISVVAGQTSSAIVQCALANTMISIKYSEHVKQYFSDYSSWVIAASDSLHFEKNETKVGYFSGEPIQIKAELSSSIGGSPVFVKGVIEDPKIKHHYIITIDGYQLDGSVRPIEIELDNTVDETNITFSNVTINEGLVAYYPLNANTDEIISHFDGVASGAVPTFDRYGNASSAYHFDGIDDFITMGDVLDSVFTGSDQAFSFAFWMRADTVKKQIILAKSSDSNCSANERQFHLKLSSDHKLQLATMFDLGYHHSHRVVTTSHAIPNESNWVHITVTYDGAIDEDDGLSRVNFYVDGEKAATEFFSVQRVLGAMKDGNAQFAMGNQINSNGENCGNFNYKGGLDELRIYNRVLTEQEVRALVSISG